MLSTPPECGTPCGLTEALAHDNARLKAENARLKRAIDAATDIGIYARAVIAHDGTRKERAEWQEGWNAAQIRASEAVRQALEAP